MSPFRMNRFRTPLPQRTKSCMVIAAVVLMSMLALPQSSPGQTPEENVHRIELSTGEILTVKILEQNAETIRFVHPVLGEITLAAANVKVLPPPEPPMTVDEGQAEVAVETAEGAADQSATAAGTPAPPQTQPATMPEAPAPPPKEWKFSFLFGGALTDGNTENASITSSFTALHEDERNRTLIDAGYFFAQSNNETTENRFSTGIRHDWLNPGHKLFYFGSARYDYDEFQSWDNRVQGHLGLGYRLIEPPKWKINLLAGAGALKEFGSEDEDVRPEGLLGVEGEWQIADKHTITFTSTYFPDFSDIGEYRWVSTGGWSYLMDEKNKLSLTAGVQYEYDSVVDPGSEHYDLRAFVGLQLDF